MPIKFRSGKCSAILTKNVPSPQPRSISSGWSFPKISLGECGRKKSSGINSQVSGVRAQEEVEIFKCSVSGY